MKCAGGQQSFLRLLQDERKVRTMTIDRILQDKIMKHEHRYPIFGLIIAILGMSFFPEINVPVVIIKHLAIEILSVILLFLLSNVAKPSFYSKLTTKLGMTANIALPILFFIVFFSILNTLNTGAAISSESSEFVSFTLMKVNNILSLLSGIGIIANFVGTIWNRNNIYGFITFANLLIFVSTNKMLASFFVSKSQAKDIFFILLGVYVIGLLILFAAKVSTKRRYVKCEK